MFFKYQVKCGASPLTYWHHERLDIGRKVMLETRAGLRKGTIHRVVDSMDEDPFKTGRATCHIITDIEEDINIMSMYAKVRHVSSERTNIVHIDLEQFDISLPAKELIGTMCVYSVDEGPGSGLKPGQGYAPFHVGVIKELLDDTSVPVDNTCWVVDIINIDTYMGRLEALALAKKLKKKLDKATKDFQETELLRLIAAQDPNVAQMLEDYEKAIAKAGGR